MRHTIPLLTLAIVSFAPLASAQPKFPAVLEGHAILPAMTFVPSIGVGPIARYPASGKNEYWENDYFVAGMVAMSLLRVRKEGERLVYAEPVLKGYRIRAIKFDQHGNFYLKTDHDQLLLSDNSKKRMP